jgi:hypothetical protein
LVVVVGGVCGCAKKPDLGSPAGTVTTFDQAMKGGEFSQAAGCFAFDTQGARDSTDWSTYSESQRNLIIGKLREEKANALTSAGATYTSKGYQVGNASESGNQATVELKTSAGDTVTVQLAREGETWRILSLPGF